MPASATPTEALVLRREAAGESFLKVDALSPDRGLVTALKRVASKGPSRQRPDLFETADITLDHPSGGGATFVRDYRPTRQRPGIGGDYRALRAASAYASVLERNGVHLDAPGELFELAECVFDALADRKSPPAVLLKGLYLLARREGYPVRESWWRGLAPELRATAARVLNAPAPEELDAEQAETCRLALAALRRWFAAETDFLVPDESEIWA